MASRMDAESRQRGYRLAKAAERARVVYEDAREARDDWIDEQDQADVMIEEIVDVSGLARSHVDKVIFKRQLARQRST